MKRILITLSILLIASVSFAGEPIKLARMTPAVCGAGASGGASYCTGTELFCSTFESTTTWTASNPASADCSYTSDGTWCDGDTGTYLFGSKSFGVRGSTSYYSEKDFTSTAQTEFYIEGWFRWSAVSSGVATFKVSDTSSHDVIAPNLSASNYYQVRVKDLATTVATTYAISANTWYHVGIYFKRETTPDTSNDGVVRVWINTSTTAGFTSSDLKVSSTDVDTGSYTGSKWYQRGCASGSYHRYDNVKVTSGAPSWTY